MNTRREDVDQRRHCPVIKGNAPRVGCHQGGDRHEKEDGKARRNATRIRTESFPLPRVIRTGFRFHFRLFCLMGGGGVVC